MNKILKAALMLLLMVTTVASSPSFGGSVAGFGGSTEITQIANNAELAIADVELGIANGIAAVQAEIAAVQTAIMGNQYVKQVLQYAKMVEDTVIRYKQLATMIQNLVKTTKNIVTAPRRFAQQIKAGFSQRGLGLTSGQVRTKLATTYRSEYQSPDRSQTALKDVKKVAIDQSKAVVEQNAMLRDQWPEEVKEVERLVKGSNDAKGAVAIQGEANKIGIQTIHQIQQLRWQAMVESDAQRAEMLLQNEINEKEREAIKDFYGREFSEGNGRPM